MNNYINLIISISSRKHFSLSTKMFYFKLCNTSPFMASPSVNIFVGRWTYTNMIEELGGIISTTYLLQLYNTKRDSDPLAEAYCWCHLLALRRLLSTIPLRSLHNLVSISRPTETPPFNK